MTMPVGLLPTTSNLTKILIVLANLHDAKRFYFIMNLQSQLNDLRQRSNGSLSEGKPQRVKRTGSNSKLGHPRRNREKLIAIVSGGLLLMLILGNLGHYALGGSHSDRRLSGENKSLRGQIASFKQKFAAMTRGGNLRASALEDHAKDEEIDKLKHLVTHFKGVKTRLEGQIKQLSKRELIEQYGEGPHHVEILFSFDPESNIADPTKKDNETDTESLLIELAPTDEMPSTVFFFLKQVNATAFDGNSCYRNAGHVIQCGPAPNHESEDGVNLRKVFTDLGLENVPFQE